MLEDPRVGSVEELAAVARPEEVAELGAGDRRDRPPMSSQGSDRGWNSCPLTVETAVRIPAVKSSESPGRMQPNSSPVSAKMMASTPIVANVPKSCSHAVGCSHSVILRGRVVRSTP
ncbi:hypothetical protein LUW74_34985 [Actinomadura madurae]|uniref:hypothetical protein n=1 Tax=Actinomadura madurae TaxID=1993 RepID=UPI002026B691|nr:hypothetical protein [Actinomadura madurae]MCP9968412.1 hypothetical protein [Actinomadura madurae]URN08060.1 hypothetical protein LUW74_34985 [Actinomadura madurae]